MSLKVLFVGRSNRILVVYEMLGAIAVCAIEEVFLCVVNALAQTLVLVRVLRRQ
jgi:hypothetical protein